MKRLNGNRTEVAKAVCKKVYTLFPETPEGKLMYAVVERAILDLTEQTKYTGSGEDPAIVRRTAERYLLQPFIEAAELCSVDSDYIRTILFSTGLLERPPYWRYLKIGYSDLNRGAIA